MAPTQQQQQTSKILYIIAILLLILICQIAYSSINNSTNITLRGDKSSSSSSSSSLSSSQSSSTTLSSSTSTSSTTSTNPTSFNEIRTKHQSYIEDELYGTMYYLKNKSPPSMPSVRLTPEEEKILNPKRTEGTIYGGKLDKPHLGNIFFFFIYLFLT